MYFKPERWIFALKLPFKICVVHIFSSQPRGRRSAQTRFCCVATSISFVMLLIFRNWFRIHDKMDCAVSKNWSNRIEQRLWQVRKSNISTLGELDLHLRLECYMDALKARYEMDMFAILNWLEISSSFKFSRLSSYTELLTPLCKVQL